MFKKGLEGATWHGNGSKVLICEANERLLRKLGADVFKPKPKKKKEEKDDSSK
tara:strand:+ start:556 stop:714 length:159 start_codon:yes stop_codon:yes gene_type:complete